MEDARREFDSVVDIEADIIPKLSAASSKAAGIAKSTLRASGIEGVYTGVEGVLKELLLVVDGGVFAAKDSWHAQLLAQAAASNEAKGRGPIISEPTYQELDRLRAFRHIERNVYRHLLRDNEVVDNLDLLKTVFPRFEEEVQSFIHAFGYGNNIEDSPGPGLR